MMSLRIFFKEVHIVYSLYLEVRFRDSHLHYCLRFVNYMYSKKPINTVFGSGKTETKRK